jgi:hypothetical protein
MHMGTAMGALKYAGYQYISRTEGCAAYRAPSLHPPVNTVHAAANMHQAVISPGYGRKGQRPHQIAPVQF